MTRRVETGWGRPVGHAVGVLEKPPSRVVVVTQYLQSRAGSLCAYEEIAGRLRITHPCLAEERPRLVLNVLQESVRCRRRKGPPEEGRTYSVEGLGYVHCPESRGNLVPAPQTLSQIGASLYAGGNGNRPLRGVSLLFPVSDDEIKRELLPLMDQLILTGENHLKLLIAKDQRKILAHLINHQGGFCSLEELAREALKMDEEGLAFEKSLGFKRLKYAVAMIRRLFNRNKLDWSIYYTEITEKSFILLKKLQAGNAASVSFFSMEKDFLGLPERPRAQLVEAANKVKPSGDELVSEFLPPHSLRVLHFLASSSGQICSPRKIFHILYPGEVFEPEFTRVQVPIFSWEVIGSSFPPGIRKLCNQAIVCGNSLIPVLSFRQSEVFLYLASRFGEFCLSSGILEEIWEEDFSSKGARKLIAFIAKLRQKLNGSPFEIVCSRGQGYCLKKRGE